MPADFSLQALRVFVRLTPKGLVLSDCKWDCAFNLCPCVHVCLWKYNRLYLVSCDPPNTHCFEGTACRFLGTLCVHFLVVSTQGSFVSSFPVRVPFLFFSLRIALARASVLCWVSGVSTDLLTLTLTLPPTLEETFGLLLLSRRLTVSFVGALYPVEEVLFYFSFAENCRHEWVLRFVKCFPYTK